MILILLGKFIPGLMTLTVFQGICVSESKLQIALVDSCPVQFKCMVSANIKNNQGQYALRYWCVFKVDSTFCCSFALECKSS